MKCKRKEKIDKICNRAIAQNIIKTLRLPEIPALVIIPPMLKIKIPYKLYQKRDLNTPPTKQALKYYTTIAKKKTTLNAEKAALNI